MSSPTLLSILSEAGRRSVNQDAALAHQFEDGRELVAVADGMGGHAAGEIASQQALEILRESLETGAELEEAVKLANAGILQASADNPDWEGMGTTLVALLREGRSYWIANVGDSRAYRVYLESIKQITADHTYSAESTREGYASADEAARSPWRRALTRAVGTDEQVEVDIFGPLAVEPAHAVLLCTDGVHGVVPDDRILDFIRDAVDAEEAARLLMRAALDSGSDDNVTVAVVAFGFPPSPIWPKRMSTSSPSAGQARVSTSRPASARPRRGAAKPPKAGAAPLRRSAEEYWRELVSGENTLFLLVVALGLIWFLWWILSL